MKLFGLKNKHFKPIFLKNKGFFHNTVKRMNEKKMNNVSQQLNFLGMAYYQSSKHIFQKGFNQLAKSEVIRTNLMEERMVDWEEVLEEIERGKKELMERNQHLLKDENSKGHLLMSALILSWFRILNKYGVEQMKIMHLLKFCTSEQINVVNMLLTPVEVAIKFNQDPLPILKKEIEIFSDAVLGESFEMEFQHQPNTYMIVNFNKCFFNKFFRENDCAFLTQVFCAADNKFSTLADPKKHGIDVQIPFKLSTDHSFCQFRFMRKQFNQEKDKSLVDSII